MGTRSSAFRSRLTGGKAFAGYFLRRRKRVASRAAAPTVTAKATEDDASTGTLAQEPPPRSGAVFPEAGGGCGPGEPSLADGASLAASTAAPPSGPASTGPIPYIALKSGHSDAHAAVAVLAGHDRGPARPFRVSTGVKDTPPFDELASRTLLSKMQL